MGIVGKIRYTISKYAYLYNYYQAKKEDYISDIIIPHWKAKLTEDDIGSYRISIDLGNGHTASGMVVYVEEFGFFCKNVHLNIEFIDDYDYIVHYKFFDFVRDYGDTLMYLLDNGGIVDINKLYNI